MLHCGAPTALHSACWLALALLALGTARHTVCRRHGTRTPALHRRLHSNALHPTHPPSCLQQVMAQVAGTVRSWFRIGFHIHVKSMSYGSSLNLRPVHFG